MIPPKLVEAALEVVAVLTAEGIRCCVIGGIAVQRWGEPRATQDVDLTLMAPPAEESLPLDVLLRRFHAGRADAREFALVSRVLLIRASNGVAIDVALSSSPFEQEVLDRSSIWELAPGVALPTCSAEDLLVYKLVAARTRDLADIEGIVRRQGLRLDLARVRRYGRLFAELKGDPDLLRPFETVLARARE